MYHVACLFVCVVRWTIKHESHILTPNMAKWKRDHRCVGECVKRKTAHHSQQHTFGRQATVLVAPAMPNQFILFKQFKHFTICSLSTCIIHFNGSIWKQSTFIWQIHKHTRTHSQRHLFRNAIFGHGIWLPLWYVLVGKKKVVVCNIVVVARIECSEHCQTI